MRDLRQVVAAAPIAIVVADADGRIVLVNEQGERLFGYAADELIGRPIESLVPERYRETHPGLRGAYLGSPEPRPMGAGRDLYAQRKDGTEVPVEIGLNPVETDEGRRILAAIVDITERKRSEEHLRRVVDAAPCAMLVVDTNGAITLINAQTSALFGYAPDELLGAPVEMLIPARFRGAHGALRREYAEQPVVRPMGAGRDLFALRKDGAQIPVEIGLSALTTPKGEFVLASVVDISERKNAVEMRLQRDRAVDASQLKSQFLATMSHELRTPLNAIIGSAELLGTTVLDDRQRTYVGTIEESAEALLANISSILDLSKIEAGKVELDANEFDLEAVVEASAGVVSQHVRQKGLRLSTFVDPSIPPILRGDADRLRQILLNLLANALKFTERGRIALRVIPVETSRRHATVRFEVEDTGIGMDPAVVPKLFEPFVQGDSSSSRRYGGTGLGLSISKRLVDLMRGEIGVESTRNAGSTFWFTARFARSGAAVPVRRIDGVRALVVTSDDDVAQILATYVQAWGIPTVRARGIDGIANALLEHPATQGDSIVLVDVDSADVPLVVTALGADGIGPNSVIPFGGDEHVTKPIRQAVLFERIVHTLGHGNGEPAATGQAPSGRLTGKVLVAEDNASLQEILQEQFARLGVAVSIVSDGAQAIEALARERYALVFMDVHMPNVDGFAATRAIRAAERASGTHMPIVAMTANAFKEDREACLASGMDDYLSKPLRINDLRSMVERWLADPSRTSLQRAESVRSAPRS